MLAGRDAVDATTCTGRRRRASRCKTPLQPGRRRRCSASPAIPRERRARRAPAGRRARGRSRAASPASSGATSSRAAASPARSSRASSACPASPCELRDAERRAGRHDDDATPTARFAFDGRRRRRPTRVGDRAAQTFAAALRRRRLARRRSLITPAIIIAYIWVWAGFAMVVIAAGLAAIPRDVLEAARTDGATEWQVFRRVTVPLLAPVLSGRLHHDDHQRAQGLRHRAVGRAGVGRRTTPT